MLQQTRTHNRANEMLSISPDPNGPDEPGPSGKDPCGMSGKTLAVSCDGGTIISIRSPATVAGTTCSGPARS